MGQPNKKSGVKSDKQRKRKKSKFRLLPLVIFFCVLTLSVRVGVVWRGLFAPQSFESNPAQIVAVSAVQAQSSADDKKPKDDGKLSSKVAQAVASAQTEEKKKAETSKNFSQSELEILQKLAQRREELDVRERSIEQRAGVLKAAEAQIDAKVVKLRELEASIKDLIGLYDEKEKARMTNLVKIYSTMKPKEAARLFNDMEMDLLVRVFEQMKEAKSAPILALMDSAKANALTVELANKRRLPGYDSENGDQK